MTAIAVPTRTVTARVNPLAGLAHTLTLAWRTLVQIRHNPMELLDFSVQPIMFVVLFTYVFGGAIAGSPGKYLAFALPGIIVQNLLFTSLNTGVALNSDLTKGFFDRLRSLPIARWAPLAGRIVADMVKQAWAVALLLGMGMILGFRVHTNVFSALAAVGLLLLFFLAMSWVAVLLATLVDEPEKVMIFAFIVVFPLTFASSAFARTSTMPGWLQAFVKVNPVTFLSDAVRGLLSGGPVAQPVTFSLAWAAGIAVVFAPLAVASFKRRS